jgi:DNA-binding transcriptional LysR family regulator
MDRNALSLDQLRVFATIVEHGGFAAAARRLNRAQSAITYAVQKLETEIGTALFDRNGYRPQLSEAGRALLPRAQIVLQEIAAFQAHAQALANGLEPELALVIDAMFPMRFLMTNLAEFQARFPSVRLRLLVESLGAAADMVVDGGADLGLLIAFASHSDELVQQSTLEIELTPVAVPAHPLALKQGENSALRLTAEDAREHLQLVLTDRSQRTRGQDNGVMSVNTWRLADLGAKHTMLLAGLGWGSLPRHMVEDDLAAGRLVELVFDQWDGMDHPPRLMMAVVHRKDRVLGPAGRWLLERLALLPGFTERRQTLSNQVLD